MTPRQVSAKQVPRDRSRVYLDKALEFYEAMVDAAAKSNWNAVGLAGVHCCISATDSLLVKHAGLRSSSSDHQDVVGLLKAHIRHPDCARQARRLAVVLAQKNLIEYVERSYPKKEAEVLILDVERYFGWARALAA